VLERSCQALGIKPLGLLLFIGIFGSLAFIAAGKVFNVLPGKDESLLKGIIPLIVFFLVLGIGGFLLVKLGLL